jgi:hypothetical protein
MARVKKEKPVDWRDPTAFYDALDGRVFSGAQAYKDCIKSPAHAAHKGSAEFARLHMGKYIEDHCLHGELHAYVRQAWGIIKAAEVAASPQIDSSRATESWATTLHQRMTTGQSVPVYFKGDKYSALIQFKVTSLIPALDFDSLMQNFFNRYNGAEIIAQSDALALFELRDLNLSRALTPRISEEPPALNDSWVSWAVDVARSYQRAIKAYEFVKTLFGASDTTLAAFRTFAGLRVVCEAFGVPADRIEMAQQVSRGARVDQVNITHLRAIRPQWAFDWEQHREVLMAMATAKRLHPDTTNHAETIVVLEHDT